MVSFRKSDWVNYGRWVQPTLSGCFWPPWSTTASVKKAVPNVFLHTILFLDGNTLVRAQDQQALRSTIHEMNQNNSIKAFIRTIEQIGNQTKQKHLDILTKTLDPIEYLDALFDTYQEMAGFWWLTLVMADEVESYISQKNLGVDSNQLVSIIEALRKPTWIEEQSQGIKQIVRMIKKTDPELSSRALTENWIKSQPFVSKAIQSHVDTYRWFGNYHWSSDAYTLDTCVQEIKKATERGILGEKKSKPLQNPNPLFELLAVLSFWRTHCAEVTAKVVFLSGAPLKKVATENGLTYEQLCYLSNREIMSHLKTGQKLSNHLEERKPKWGSYLEENGTEHIFTGNELQKLIDKIVPKPKMTSTQLKGTVAFAGGVIRGTVKVVISPSDFKNFKEDDILVAPEITPDFVPLMKKAKAVICDRGGIASQAAIISPEIEVPCIIGTNTATSMLKDGDRVEIDTKKGLIKKIK